ncbi:DUF5675 family protein [Chondrinema litorale]|uniref:DUF5675 family protein n=1 Tax=Chondrinema litorale TaxID=2994555 RepID=UPI002542BEFC|nr:DUF5675 family protein [Chondrinema litorale]UZR95336.1 DUF5675 family protein [Chondrinema litorale]
MKNILTRLYDDGKQTLGEWRIYEKENLLFECKILELPYKDNQSNKSCIPKGTYLVKKRHDQRSKFKYPHLHIQNVVNRDWILIHVGNFYTQTAGCMLPGAFFYDLNKDGLKDVTSSEKTLSKMMELLPESFVLEIV